MQKPHEMARDDPSNNGKPHGDDDRLSDLPDHVLVLVLQKLRGDVWLLARTCVLSKWWKTLPLMLPWLTIAASSFLPSSHDSAAPPLPPGSLDQATSKLAGALQFFLDSPAGGQQDVECLKLGLHLAARDDRDVHEIGQLVGGAVAGGEVWGLELVLQAPPPLAARGGYKTVRLVRAVPPRVLSSLGKLMHLAGRAANRNCKLWALPSPSS
ncbi:hypothetical protein ACP70R_048241 [Stipagrostis hirtigluma subsp. patula]